MWPACHLVYRYGLVLWWGTSERVNTNTLWLSTSQSPFSRHYLPQLMLLPLGLGIVVLLNTRIQLVTRPPVFTLAT